MNQYEKEHLEYVVKNAGECTVLLKKDGKFPLEKPGKIAAFGSGMRYSVKGGTGSGEVNTRVSYTIEEGLEKCGFDIVSKEWLDEYDNCRSVARKQFISTIRKEAKAAHQHVMLYGMGKNMLEPCHNLKIHRLCETAIYVVSRISGEGCDRRAVAGDVKLTESEIKDILTCNEMYEHFMLVLNVGGVVDLTPVNEVGNILLLSQLGIDNGRILADILLGKQNPSGKLTTTWASWEEYGTEGTFGEWNETRYQEGIYVGYRYFDTFGKKPLFPFGYGLSYTSFDIKTISVSCVGDLVTIVTSIKNTGEYAGKEVVQCYLTKPEGMLDQPYQELVGFTKTSLLASGEQEKVVIEFRLSDFASYDEQKEVYVLEEGLYILRLGNSSKSTEIAAVIDLEQRVETLCVKNCLGKPDFDDCKPVKRSLEQIPDNVEHIVLSWKNFSKETVSYEQEEIIDERVKDLTEDELAYLLIGGFDPNAKGLAVIGNASTHVIGAAGETTSVLQNKGIQPLIMADGPAGLRLSKAYFEDEKGRHDASGEGTMPESMVEFLSPIMKRIILMFRGKKKIPQDAEIKEQIATMIPIGTAVAQSFNLELARNFGDIVGKEMQLFGVHLWLAPALNIHRSILCGRNFEYYSEDPLVSGLMAAAITQGVQAHKGCGVTIKHYAANNAETNRYCNNSQVSERAMREIYLRGFGICVKKSEPKAVMTSYNLLNGIHTSEHRGLIEDVLRREYGFSGIVMTDWVIAMMTDKKSTHRNALSPEVVKAGGDLFMPGGKADYTRLCNAIKAGEITRKQLEINGTRVIKMVEELA